MAKIAYAQMLIEAGRPDVNSKRILYLIERARAGGAKVVIFPELALSGQFVGDVFKQESFLRDCVGYGEDIIAASRNMTVVFGNVKLKWDAADLSVFNTIFIAKDGKQVGTFSKRKLSADERRYFNQPTAMKTTFDLQIDGHTYKVLPMFNADSVTSNIFDFCIKFDTEPFSTEKNLDDETVSVYKPMIQVSAVGVQNNGKTVYAFDGTSGVFNSDEELVQRAESFTEALKFVELDEINDMPVLKELDEPESAKIYRVLYHGVKSFLQQIGMSKVVIGASGGIDSAVAAALYVKVIGAENVLLVNMPSVFNSETTKGLSAELARNLGCKYCVVPIQEAVDYTVKQLESTPVTLADGSTEKIELTDFMRENIQARDRSSRILAALAASVGGGFTCNANKAETTVGYATLYGDAAGFLSALADLWKFQVYALARYINTDVYGREVIPQGIIDLTPSAELSNAQNVDEGKGDPLKYPYHDYLFRAFVEQNLRPEDILRMYDDGTLEKNIGCEVGLVKKYFPTAKDFVADLERWWKQFSGIGVAKRIQSPPILAVSRTPLRCPSRIAEQSPLDKSLHGTARQSVELTTATAMAIRPSWMTAARS